MFKKCIYFLPIDKMMFEYYKLHLPSYLNMRVNYSSQNKDENKIKFVKIKINKITEKNNVQQNQTTRLVTQEKFKIKDTYP